MTKETCQKVVEYLSMYISKINIQIIMIVCTFLIHQYQKLLGL